jgi:hypothetical protein
MSLMLNESEARCFTGVFRGDGVSSEQKAFQSQFTGELVLGGKGFRIQCVAHDSEGQVVDEEEAMLWPETDGAFSMHHFSTALGRALLKHNSEDAQNGIHWQFTTGDWSDTGVFRMRVALRKLADGEMEYLREWAMPGQVDVQRSSTLLKRY